MKTFFKFLLFFVIVILIILYFFSIKEGMEVLKIEGGYFQNIFKTFEYFFMWGIPYWWSYIIIVSVVLSFLGMILLRIFRKY